jgi:hypothetical protein
VTIGAIRKVPENPKNLSGAATEIALPNRKRNFRLRISFSRYSRSHLQISKLGETLSQTPRTHRYGSIDSKTYNANSTSRQRSKLQGRSES